ncbi:imidazole glycerol phosphate synthase subunit HisH [Sphingomonas rhizophila]|uniref:Imidazole glycerol phosphate synthase subunit HisH n=1 Tax=Sphingomonas rhizophila TaxID=2071607 RepID=A0A7G9SBT2_9SPHN|nr:imidazole glycerol phosphate synthase subunit HisH [Sphingomonas rhizophila]QNN65307.1 imidazole glycerol phosphate synthase subunit HisH [Sphingomonas rhizophila]
MSTLGILDLGYGNTDSIRLAFARLGVEADLVSDVASIEGSERLVLPGVGAAGYAMQQLRDRALVEPLRRRTRPTLGICLGMQLMFEASDEGDTECLALVGGRVRAMASAPGAPVPHMGWSKLEVLSDQLGITDGDYAYFAHGFACDDGPATAAATGYGGKRIPAALRQGPLWGAQFHPERSSTAGAAFLRAFLQS